MDLSTTISKKKFFRFHESFQKNIRFQNSLSQLDGKNI